MHIAMNSVWSESPVERAQMEAAGLVVERPQLNVKELKLHKFQSVNPRTKKSSEENEPWWNRLP